MRGGGLVNLPGKDPGRRPPLSVRILTRLRLFRPPKDQISLKRDDLETLLSTIRNFYRFGAGRQPINFENLFASRRILLEALGLIEKGRKSV